MMAPSPSMFTPKRSSKAIHPAAAWLRTIVPASAHLSCDSRTVRPGDVFLAWPGARFDARLQIHNAVAQKASAVLWDNAGFEWNDAWSVPNRGETALKEASGQIAADWYGRPSAQLWSVGITGTSGKTSTALWIAQAFSSLGKRCAVVGTLGIGFIDAIVETGLTTPDPVWLQRSLRNLVNDGAQALAMEVSSIGLIEGRSNGMSFDVALFTNLSHDHLDYHGDMALYEAAKARLFAWDDLRTAVVNLDDAAGARMASIARAHGAQVMGFSAEGLAEADLRARNLAYSVDGMRFDVHGHFGVRSIKTDLIGSYNVSNLLGVLGVLLASNVSIDDAILSLRRLQPAPGRLQRVMPVAPQRDAPMVLIDYAHKPDALDKALTACRPLATARQGRLIVVFGCGGDRDVGKRPVMAAIAERLADTVIITSDNPRSEDPQTIINAIVAGMKAPFEAQIEVDRAQAIRQALLSASAQDVVLIAGKGHETYQEIVGVKHPFSDMEVATRVLSEVAA